ncbi:DNA helicase, UvrD-like, C-terminal [Penicillium expansum]|uniref:DNA helicase, UvrD-like, C-terminal n=1 Tax=Penicillium expansum TaxID=27334 RepID=A0A0A2JHI7_PENEN|nr:DNA helicase, UvrD-like, C-terminal [Penicillium expansum]KGO54138.1 DNA helicase, UvrD-like, C-terminal [Penicillium expansum]KGO61568.1 DNA helicase, UvrD-like, C-terminal [Penicillium expansum]
MVSVQTPWTSILLQEKPGLHEYNHALSNVERYYTRLQEAMQDGSVHDQLVLNPDQTHSRLLKCFEILRAKQLPGPVAEEIFKAMVLPFLHDNIFSPPQMIQLVGSALPLITKQQSQFLRDLTKTLLSSQDLFDNLVANEKYTVVLKEWLLSKRSHLPLTLSRQVGDRLITMCNACSADHGTQAIVESWNIAEKLMESINSLIHTSYEEELKKTKVENLPPLESMKVLNRDDKKSTPAEQGPRKDIKEEFKVSSEILQQMNHFGILPPLSARGLTNAAEHLQNEIIPALTRSALDSFPCRICLDRLTTGSLVDTLASSTALPSDRTTAPSSAQDIFGKRVGLWKVLLSDIAFKNAKKLVRGGDFGGVEQKLRDLASGEWKGKDLSRRVGSKQQKKKMQVPILEVSASATVSILWQVDVGFYDELPWVQQQIVKGKYLHIIETCRSMLTLAVWQIVTSEEELETAIEQIILIQESYTAELAQLCLERPVQQSDGTWTPRQFGNVKETGSSQMRSIASSKASPALVEMSNKFYNLTEPFLKSIVNKNDAEEFPFDLSPEELEIVKHFSTSSLILGRSGTGKTTCLLFKMLAKHKARQSASDEQQARQLLLTRSSYLASKLQTYAKSLIDAQSKAPSIEEDVDLDLKPTSFFALKNWHFPIVCTYDEFLGLLENTIRMADRKDFLRDINPNKTKSLDPQVGDKPRVIDFSIFKTEYWGSLSGLSPPSCSPELLFAEIMGVIKGSSITAKSLKPLYRAEYVKKSAKASPAFTSEAERDKVFGAFERYEKQKRLRKEVDELDRVSVLLKSLRDNRALAKQIQRCFDEIYVDEIQDLRCLDIVLLLGCLSDARGIHLAGDTAQCISKDSVFRFPEIKALFYEHYEVIANELNQPSFAKPVQFSLAKNYRSHQGILSFASWVMQLLWHGFPETIDKLDPEIGYIGGPKPIIFAGFDSSILSAKMIGLVKLNDKVADFGAEQVILVRDDTSKDKLQTQIGDIALVLTILESKGMEFDDVLVYDFFGSSGLGSSYRCLHMLVQVARAQFDSQKHAALCSELKSLYVAVTRARKQLWFMETQENSIDPILQTLSRSNSLELAEVVRQKDPNVAGKVMVLRAGGSVDPERWLKRAAHLLHRKSFAEALFCYKKANDSRGMTHSQACLHEQEGRSHRAAGDTEEFAACYEKAIALFLEIGLITEAAMCYEGLGQFGKVAEIWKDREQYQKAATFYEKGALFTEASECYHSCGQYEAAIEVLRRGDQFDELVTYANRNREYLSEPTLLRYSRLCNILLKQGRVSASLRAITINMLGSDVSKIAFFKEFEMWDQLRALYSSKSRWFEYYDLSVAVGDIPAAISTLLVHKLMPVVDKPVVEKLFNYSMVEVLHSQRDLIPGKPERDGLLKSVKSTYLEKLGAQWKSLLLLMDDFDDIDQPASVKHLDKGLLKDVFCLFVISFEPSVFTKQKIEHLPMDIVIRVGKLLQDFYAQNQYSLTCLAMSCGIFTNPKQENQTILLHWSPLRTYTATPLDGSSSENLLDIAKDFIQDKFAAALTQFHENAYSLMKRDFPPTCFQQLYEGFCSKLKANECFWGHEKPTAEFAISKLNCLLTVAEVFARLTPIYYQRVMGEAFSKPFLGRRRTWIQHIQEELVIVSSLEQSSTAIANLRSNLQSNPEFAATAYCLEELLFYRMNKEWSSMGSLSSSLEKVQEAQILGPHPATRFQRALVLNMDRNMPPRPRRSGHPLALSLTALNAAERIRSAVARRHAQDFHNGVSAFAQCLEKTPKSSLGSLHAVLSVLEFAATYVLCIANPGRGIVIPWSWALQHLSTIMQSPAKDYGFKDREIRVQTTDLMSIVISFCNLMEQVESALTNGVLRFQGLGRSNLPIPIVKRRCTELLTTVNLNLNHWPKQPIGFKEMEKVVNKTLRSTLIPPGMALEFSNSDRFRQSCIREYAAYNHKDELCVIALDDRKSAPLFLRSFTQGNAKFAQLSDILQVSRIAENPLSMGLGEEWQVDEYTGYELDMITNLQRRWRQVMKVLENNRFRAQTREGKLVQHFHKVCMRRMSVLPAAAWSTRDKIHMRKVIFTDGMKIAMALDGVLDNFRQLKERWRQQFDSNWSTAKLEELSVIRGRILPIDGQLEYIVEHWSPKGIDEGMMTVPAQDLGSSAREAQRALWAVQREIEIIRSQVEIIAKSPDR